MNIQAQQFSVDILRVKIPEELRESFDFFLQRHCGGPKGLNGHTQRHGVRLNKGLFLLALAASKHSPSTREFLECVKAYTAGSAFTPDEYLFVVGSPLDHA